MIVFFSIAFLTILITNILTKSNNEIPQIKVLGFSDALHIFLINTLNILIFLLFSITGWIYVKMLDTQKLSFCFYATMFIGSSTSRVAYQSEEGF